MKDTVTYPLSAITGDEEESRIDQLERELVAARAEIVRLTKRREWINLTHEEIQAIHDTYYRRMGRMEFARAIEAKLKEKNCG